ncbi:solute carrier family 26 [Seminavis robusta]|uniref:Solute carrier family 26 n=1 Tax=Seminavis robusta TaxID=568900 RepID=A0A9N8H3J8_9STRA|nr:solute carrier family 26 [Seminavis robusta]|eukprot:Sro62_g035480.1 solute carrier family 26 (1127) ;mRNA; f:100365-104150
MTEEEAPSNSNKTGPTHRGATGSTVGLSIAEADEGAGSVSHLQSLFRQTGPPPPPPLPVHNEETETQESTLERKITQKTCNSNSKSYQEEATEQTSLLAPPPAPPPNNPFHSRDDSFVMTSSHPQSQSRLSSASYDSSGLSELFLSPSSQKTPKMGPAGASRKIPTPPLSTTSTSTQQPQAYNTGGSVREQPVKKQQPTPNTQKKKAKQQEPRITCQDLTNPTTYIGAFMFVLYHVVFTLASGSAIQRPHANNSILGLMTKMGALGIIFAGPVYLYNIGNGLPCMYPTCDLFLAPIFASIAKIIDDDLALLTNLSDEENDDMFLATFGVLAFIGMGLAGALLLLAGVFRVANLGAFLPYPVLCGFFTAVGILTWHLGFVVDTSGKSFRTVFLNGDTSLIGYALMHHIPGVIVAIIMKYLGPKNPAYVVLVLFATVATVYMVMFVTGTSLEDARGQGWFWYHEDIVYEHNSAAIGFSKWLPPAPFGVINGIIMGKVHWVSVWNGIQPACAMSFLYLIRCALHSASLLKNVPTLARTQKVEEEVTRTSLLLEHQPKPRKKTRLEKFSEIVDIEEVMKIEQTSTRQITEVERAKPTTWTLQTVLIQYGIAQVISACVGGFGTIPSVATSHAMFALRADRVAPQLGSIILIAVFYLTDFRLIAYVPKMAFSCLLSLAFIDITLTWLIRSYFKTKSKQEWLVVPLIVVFAMGMGLLKAVFLGIAISTFLFVGAFFQSGVVKFAASGLTIRSTIKRPVSSAQWLDHHGDLVQVVILQNYLFFGNCSSISSYIASMFEDVDEDDQENAILPPIPKFVVLDMALVTGMDTSTVDIISDILNLCQRHDCKLFLSGLSNNLRSVLAHAGVKPLGGQRSERKLRFFSSLDMAIGKAEDMLLDVQMEDNPGPSHLFSLQEESGFQVALRCIDEQHGSNFAKDLASLEEHTTPIELTPGESLYDSPSMPERGLFFIEKGVMKIERESGLTANTRSLASPLAFGGSISELRMRSDTIGRDNARMKSTKHSTPHQQTFRLARIGEGWVVGAVEAVSGLESVGVHLAVTSCRLHHLSYSRMEELEAAHPVVMLRLYKLLSHIMAKQQEITIGQLGTLHTIMSSPAQKGPVGRKATLMFQKLQ